MDATTLADVAALKSAPAAHVKTLIRTPDRPTPITIIAVLATIGAVLLAIGTVTAVATGALLIAGFSALFTVLALACAVGYFGMRRWAVKLYAAQTALSIFFMAVTGGISIVGLIVPAIVLALSWKHYPAMK
jgi:hypothetical protein